MSLRICGTCLALAALAAPSVAERVCAGEEVHVYAAPGGHKLRLTLFTPAESTAAPGLRPALVMVHGGGWVGGWRHQTHWFGREFARRGVVAASIDYRKLPSYGFPECIEDAKAAVRWLRAHAVEYRIDPDRIAVTGHSAGGYIALMTGATPGEKALEGTENLGYSSAVQAVVSFYGAVDFRALEDQDSGAVRQRVAKRLFERFLRSAAEKGADPYEVASPSTYISPEMPPTLFIHGDKDGLVPIGVAEAFHEALRDLGVPTAFKTMEGYGHAFERFYPNARREAFEEMWDFLDTHMGMAPKT